MSIYRDTIGGEKKESGIKNMGMSDLEYTRKNPFKYRHIYISIGEEKTESSPCENPTGVSSQGGRRYLENRVANFARLKATEESP